MSLNYTVYTVMYRGHFRSLPCKGRSLQSQFQGLSCRVMDCRDCRLDIMRCNRTTFLMPSHYALLFPNHQRKSRNQILAVHFPSAEIWTRVHILSPLTGFKARNEVGSKTTQAWGCQPMLHKMYIIRHKVSSHPFPPPSSYSPLSHWLFSLLIIEVVGIGRRGGKLDFVVDLKIRWG